jgi:hypothetical protein
MAAYIVNEIIVTDPEVFQTYVVQVPATLVPFGGRYLVRSGASEAIEGEPPGRLVILEFPTAPQPRPGAPRRPTRPSCPSATPARRRGSTWWTATSLRRWMDVSPPSQGASMLWIKAALPLDERGVRAYRTAWRALLEKTRQASRKRFSGPSSTTSTTT